MTTRTNAGGNNVTKQEHFSRIPEMQMPRSKFNRSFGLKTAFDSGYLVPIYVDEALPGDTFRLEATTLTRVATLLHPVMDNMNLSLFFFSVPYRLVWDNFKKAMGEQVDPGDPTNFNVPQVTVPSGGFAEESVFDYMGLPPKIEYDSVSALPLRAMNLIWNEWFRDQNLQDSLTVNTGDGPDPSTDYTLLKRGKRHDYFTSCLPWPQKGPEVEFGIGTSAPVNPLTSTTTPTFDSGALSNQPLRHNGVLPALDLTGNPGTAAVYWNTPGLEADLSSASAVTINEIREAVTLQHMYELDARGGTRYTEVVRNHFGVVSPDARQQRPEYLGGGTSRINVNQVEVNADLGRDVGDLGAYGIGLGGNAGFLQSFTEHSVCIGFACVWLDLNYQQGINKMWTRTTRFDHYWPALANLGEGPVYNKEIYVDGTAADDDVFGYQERWAEYRYKPSLVTGHMRSSAVLSLDTWHFSQDFASRPLLNSSFIEENPPLDRALAVTSGSQMLMDVAFDYQCIRPMPVYSVPGITRL